MAPPDGGPPETEVVTERTTHRTQLKICHEKIGGSGRPVPRLPENLQPSKRSFRWCDLPAAAWCFDCDHYVCEIHLIAKHSEHRTQVEDL